MNNNICEFIEKNYYIKKNNMPPKSECKRIFACAYRIYDEKSGATGGPGGMLHIQESLLKNRFKGIVTRYIYRDENYRVPDDIWMQMTDLSFQTKRILAAAGYMGTHSEIVESIENGDNPLFVCHDLGSALGAHILGCNYVLIYHQQGSIICEIESTGERIDDIEKNIISEIEELVISNSIKTYFPSLGARKEFINTSLHQWSENEEKLSNKALYNTIPEIEAPIVNNKSEILEKINNLDSQIEVFMSISDYVSDKGLDRIPNLLKVYKEKTQKNILWIVVGNVINQDLYDNICNKCREFGVDCYLNSGRVSHSEAMWLLRRSDYYIMLHRKSIFDLAILEAMQLGKKIILSDCVANLEFNVRDNVIIYDGDAKNTIQKILDKDYRKWENDSIVAFKEFFSNDAFVERYAKEIKSTLLQCGMYPNYTSSVNEGLKVLKNKYIGKKCVICGSGISLEAIQDMDTDCMYMALNRALFYDKIKYDFVFLQDDPTDENYTLEDFNAYDCIKFYGIITNKHSKTLGIGDGNCKFKNVKNKIYRYELSPNLYDYRVDSFFMNADQEYVMDGQSVLFSALILAVYLGFSDIKLCGVDFGNINYGMRENPSHYAENVMKNLVSLKRELSSTNPNIKLGFVKTTNSFLEEEFMKIDFHSKITVSSIYTNNYFNMVELQRLSCKDDYVFEPIFISDDKWNKAKSVVDFAFYGGNTLKVEAVIEKIKEHFGEMLLFTDADLVFFRETKGRLLCELEDNDIVFLKERSFNQPIFEKAKANINIGFVLMRCNESTLLFWNNIYDRLINEKGWDQEIANNLLLNYDYPMKWELLSEEFLNGGSITKDNILNQRICTACGTVAKRLNCSKSEFLEKSIIQYKKKEWF